MSLDGISTLDDARLRYVLIGNNDMKFSLLSDKQFMDGFGRRFAANCAHQDWQALHDQAIVLRLLSTFDDMSEEALDVFEGIVQLIVVQLDLSINGTIAEGDTPLVEETVEYFLESLIHLSNHRFFKYDGERLWNFVIQMLYEKRSLGLLNLLIRITPILLKCFKLAHHKRLLYILFALLHSGCSQIVELVLSYYSINLLDESEVLEDLRLPNFDIPPHFFKENPGFSLLIPLLTSFLQIYNYVADNNLEFVPGDDFETAFGTVYITCLLFLKASSTAFTPSESKLVSVLSLNFICMFIEQTYKLRSNDYASDPVASKTAADVKNETAKLHATISKNYLKILYKIDECFDYNPDIVYIHSPVKLLAHICDLFPTVGNNYIRNTTLDTKVRITIIDQLKKNGWLFEFWHHSKDFTSLLDFTALDLMGKSSSRSSASSQSVVKDNYNKHSKTLKFGDVNCSSIASSTNLISDLFHLLSIYTCSEEDHRQRIIKDISELPLILFQIVETHRYLLLQLQVNYRELRLSNITPEKKVWISKNIGIVIYLLDLPVFTNCFYFMRSLSRSVNALRTLFVECNGLASVLCGDRLSTDDDSKDPKKFTANKGRFIYNILQVVNGIECGTKFIRLLTGQTSKVQLTNKLIVLALISNLILDFLSFRLEIVNNSNFVLNLLRIYKSGEASATNELEVEAALVIQYHVLWVLKNLLYNENSESKRRVVQVFPLQVILKNCSFDNVKSKHFQIELNKKLVAFEILQNLTSGSPEFIAEITLGFQTLASSERILGEDKKPIVLWDDFVIWNISNYKLFTDGKAGNNTEMLLKMLANNKYAELVCSIFYIENHKYVSLRQPKEVAMPLSSLIGDCQNNEDDPMDGYSENLFPLLAVLSIWLFFLEFEIPPDYPLFTKVVNNLTDINLAITWNLVNLTKKPNDSLDRWFGVGNVKLTLVGRDNVPRSATAERSQTQTANEADTGEEEDEDLDKLREYDEYFELYDTVDAVKSHASVPRSLFESIPRSRELLFEDSKQEITGDIDLLTAEGRAAYLKGVGFTDALQVLLRSKSVVQQSMQSVETARESVHRIRPAHRGIDLFGAVRPGGSKDSSQISSASGNARSGFRRFEAVHSDDLVDKVRLVNRQIYQLLMNQRKGDGVDKGQEQDDKKKEGDEDNNTLTSSGPSATLIPITAVSPLQDIMYGIQRGGEGFGYGLDEDYMSDEAVVMSEDEADNDGR